MFWMQNDQLIVLHPKQNVESELKWQNLFLHGANQIELFIREFIRESVNSQQWMRILERLEDVDNEILPECEATCSFCQ